MIVGENVPEARQADEIPWDEVGPGWHVVLYDSSRANPTGPGDVSERPVIAYVVSPNGDLYQAATWPVGEGPYSIADTAGFRFLGVGSSPDWQAVHMLVDLETGSSALVSVPDTGTLDGPWPLAGLTRPTGKHLIVWNSDGTTEWLDRQSYDGTKLSRLFSQPYTGWSHTLSWLYGYEGSTVVVGHAGGVAYVDIGGEVIRELAAPGDAICEPVRWWDANTVLARCRQDDPSLYHFQLWLIRTDGAEPQALTAPDPNPDVVDFGFVDAWPTADRTLLQWAGDCGASQLETLQPLDGTGSWLETPWMEGIDGYRLVDVVDGVATIHAWRGCDASEGTLDAMTVDGSLVRHLVPIVGDARGVIDAAGLATVYP